MVPPDLSLIARGRGTDYLYTFLQSFYADPAKPTGVNNIVLPGTAMPHVLWELQGVQEAGLGRPRRRAGQCAAGTSRSSSRAPRQAHAEEYDEFVRDTVNFLDYIGEPAQLQRARSASRCIAFLVFFTLLA